MKLKNQGVVAYPNSQTAKKKKTKLTFLVHMDPGGIIPSGLAKGISLTLMHFPKQIVDDMKAQYHEQGEHGQTSFKTSLVSSLRAENSELKSKVASLVSELEKLREETGKDSDER